MNASNNLQNLKKCSNRFLFWGVLTISLFAMSWIYPWSQLFYFCFAGPLYLFLIKNQVDALMKHQDDSIWVIKLLLLMGLVSIPMWSLIEAIPVLSSDHKTLAQYSYLAIVTIINSAFFLLHLGLLRALGAPSIVNIANETKNQDLFFPEKYKKLGEICNIAYLLKQRPGNIKQFTRICLAIQTIAFSILLLSFPYFYAADPLLTPWLLSPIAILLTSLNLIWIYGLYMGHYFSFKYALDPGSHGRKSDGKSGGIIAIITAAVASPLIISHIHDDKHLAVFILILPVMLERQLSGRYLYNEENKNWFMACRYLRVGLSKSNIG